MTEGAANLKFAGTRDLRLTGKRITTNSRRRSGLTLWALFALAVCFSVRAHAQTAPKPAAVAPNPGGAIVVTNSTTSSYVDRDIPVTAAVDNYSTTLVVLLNDAQISSQTFPNAFSDPTVAAAVTAAEGVLSGDAAGFGSPVQTANTSVLQSSTTVTSPTPMDTNISTGVTVVTTTDTFGPATILVGENQSQTFTVLAGQEDINVNTNNQYYAYVYVTTTKTYLVSQTYQISGVTGGAAAVPTPATLAFPGTPSGTTTTALPITLSNTGAAVVNGISISLGGANPSNFAITTGTNACGSIIDGRSCSIYVTFTPSSVANFTATLSIASSAVGSPQTVSLSGIGTGPQLQFSPGLLNFTAGTPGVPGDTGNGAAAISALVDGGTGMAFDSKGNLYFSDALNNTVRQINTSGTISTFAGTPVSGAGSYAGDNGPAASAALNGPQQIAFDGSGNLYIADMSNNVIRMVNASGTISTFAGTYGSGVCGFAGANGPVANAILCNPQGVAVDALGNVYIADTGNNIIRKVDPSGTITLFAGTPTQSGYSGNNQAANKALLSSPTQVATDLAGNVYILDSGNNVIRKVDGSGIITTYAGGGIGGVGTTSAPATDVSIQAVGIATDLAGNLYIATGSSVYVVDPNQNISLLVGEGSSQASGIPATQTSLGATAVAVDASGDLFVNDATDYMIYEVGPYGDLVFGSQDGNTTSSMPVTLTNTGDAAVTFSAPTVTGDFAIASGGSCDFSSLAAGASCTANVTFTPTAVGARTGTISIPTNTPNTPNTVQLSGTGVAATAPDFTITTLTPTKTVTQGGDAATYILTITAVNGFGGTIAFTPSSSYPIGIQWPASITIAPGGSQNITVVLTSALSPNGDFSATITGTTSSGLQHSLVLDIVVQNPALTPTVTVTPIPSSITTAQPDLVTVTVNGGSDYPVPTGYVTLTSGTYTSGAVTLSGGSAMITIPAGALATSLDTLTATYTPDSAGAIYFANTTGTNTVTVTAPPVFVSNVGTALAAQLVTVPITTAGTLNSIQVLTQGLPGLDFTKTSGGTCATTTGYTVGETCTVNVIFKPQVPGARPGAVLLTDASNNILGIAYLPGMGIGPEITFNPGVQSTLPSYSGLNAAVPEGVAVDAGLNVYVVDLLYGSVNKYPWTGNAYGAPVQLPFTDLYDPEGVAVDGAGNVFVADFGDSRVVELPWNGSSYGTQIVLASYGFEDFPTPTAVAVDSHGNLFFVLLGHATVPSALMEMPWTGSGYGSPTTITAATGLNYPDGLAVDANLNVYIADTGNSQVVKIPWNGTSFGAEIVVASGIAEPGGVAVDGAGDVYIANDGSSPVVEVPWNGTAFGTPVTAPFTLASGAELNGIAVDGYGNLYVSSDGYERVVELNVSTPPSLSFANTTAGSVSSDSPKTAAVSNIGNAPLIFSSGTNPNYPLDFPVNSSGTSLCSPAFPLAQGGSCNVSINFEPITTGPLSEDVVLTDNDLNVSGAMQSIQVSGMGLASPGPAASLAPSSVTFTGQVQGTTSLAMAVKLSNTGDATLTGISPSITGTNPSDFAITTGTNVCGATLAASATCNIYVTFTPAAAAGFTATLSVADNASNTPQTATLNGTGVAFSSNVGTALTAQQVTVAITAAGTLGSFQVLTQGVPDLDFTYAPGGGCTTDNLYTVGQSCTVNVNFDPQAPGARPGAVELLDYSGNVLGTAYLPGVGYGPEIAFSPSVQSTLPSIGYNQPLQDTVDAGLNVYVADTLDSRIIKIPWNGTSYGTPVKLPFTGLNQPYAVAVDGSGNVFVADSMNYQVLELPWNGSSYRTQIVLDSSGLPAVAGVAVDGNGNLFFTDQIDQKLVEMPMTSSGYGAPTIVTAASGLHAPHGVTVDANLNVYIADSGDSRVVEIPWNGSSFGTEIVVPTTGLFYPEALTVDAAGDVYIADSDHGKVVEVPWNGSSFGTQIAVPFTLPGTAFTTGIAVDGYGNLYLSDGGDNVVDELKVSTPPSLTFASTSVGATSTDSPKTVTVTNIGNAGFYMNAAANNPVYPIDFPINNSDTNLCEEDNSLYIGSSCDISVNFKPTATGPLSEDVVLTDNNLNGSGVTQSIPVSGTGAILTAQTITFTQPTTPVTYSAGLSIPLVATGGASGNPVAFTIDGSSTGTGSITGSTLNVTTPGSFVIDANQAGNSTYSAAPQVQRTVVVNQASQTINFTQPTSPVTYSGTSLNVPLTATGGASGNPVTFTIDGSSTATGSITGSTLTVTSTGNLVIDANQAGNTDYSAAPQVQRTVVASAPGAQAINFTQPTTPVTYSSGLTIPLVATGGASGNPIVFSIAGSSTGTGSISGSTLSVTSVGTFVIDANQAGNSTYSAAPQVQRTVVVTQAAQAINFSQPTTPVTYSSGLTIPLSASGGASGNPVTFTIDGSSTATGTISGSTLTVTSAGNLVIDANQAGNTNYSAAPQVQRTVVVNAPAPAAPDFSVAATSPSQTVQPGGTATYPITVADVGSSFTGTVMLSVSGLPTGATGTFNPATITPGSTGGSSTLMVTTPAMAILTRPNFWPMATPALALLFMLPFRRWRRVWRGKLLLLVLGLASLAGAASLMGCGGGFGFNQSQTYTLTVTGTSGTDTHSTTVQLTVE